jgi:hypothetical protein
MVPCQWRSIEGGPRTPRIGNVVLPVARNIKLAVRKGFQLLDAQLIQPVELARRTTFRALNALATQHALLTDGGNHSRRLTKSYCKLSSLFRLSQKALNRHRSPLRGRAFNFLYSISNIRPVGSNRDGRTIGRMYEDRPVGMAISTRFDERIEAVAFDIDEERLRGCRLRNFE